MTINVWSYRTKTNEINKSVSEREREIMIMIMAVRAYCSLLLNGALMILTPMILELMIFELMILALIILSPLFM